MYTVKPSLLLAAILLSSSVQALTLKESVNEVISTDPAVQERLRNYRATLQDLNIAKSGYYPKIDLQSGIGHEKAKFHNKNYDDPDYTVYENSLTLTQNLFNGYSTTKLVEYQKNRILAASYFYIEKANDSALQMVKTYIQLIRHKELLAVVKQNLEINQEIFSKVKSLYDSGLTTLSEVEKINSSLALAQSNVVVQQNNLMDSQFNFQRALGRSPNIDELSVPVLDVTLPDSLEQASSQAVQNNPSILVSNYNIEGEQALLAQKRSSYYPTLDFQLRQEYNKNYSEEIADTKDDKLRAMVLLRYNFYNGGADRAEIKKQVSVINQKNDAKGDLNRQVIQGMELSWSAYTMLAKQLEHLYNYRDFSLKTLKLYEEEYDFGKRTLLDLLAAQNDYDSAQQEIITARYNHLLAKYRILDAMGSMVTGILDNQSEHLNKVQFDPEAENQQEMPEDTLPLSPDNKSNDDQASDTALDHKSVQVKESVVDINALCNNSIYLKNTGASGCQNLSVKQDYVYRFGTFSYETVPQPLNPSSTVLDGVSNFFSTLWSAQFEETQATLKTEAQIVPQGIQETQLDPQSKTKFNELVSFLNQAIEIQSIQLLSHNEVTGDNVKGDSAKRDYEKLQTLSAQYSQQLKQQLINNGISAQLIELVPQSSIADQAPKAGQLLNHRIEVAVNLKKPLETALLK